MSKKLFFNEYSDAIQNTFKDINDFRTFSKICIDTYKNQLQGQSKEQGNAVIRKRILEVAGLDEGFSDIQFKKAF